MNTPRALVLLASLGLATSVLVGCSKGSPTEPTMPAFESTDKSIDLSVVGEKSHGGGNDDGTADDNGSGGHGADDGTADDRGNGGHGADDGTAASQNSGRSGRGRRGGDPSKPPQAPRAPKPGAQFAGTVLSVNGNTLTLAGGSRVIVDAKTQWNARGDLLSIGKLAAAVRANRSPRVEGGGSRQADGSIVALTLKAEIDG